MKKISGYFKLTDFGAILGAQNDFLFDKDYKFIIPENIGSVKVVEYFPIEIIEEISSNEFKLRIKGEFKHSKYLSEHRLQEISHSFDLTFKGKSIFEVYSHLVSNKFIKDKLVLKKSMPEKEGVYLNQKKWVKDIELVFT